LSDVNNTLMAALTKLDVSLVKAAIASGADLTYKDLDGRTPLFEATLLGNIPIVQYLIMNGADVNAMDDRGETPLHFAAREYQVDAAKCLISHGAFVDAKDANGNTPHSTAVYSSSGRGDMIRLLLASSADRDLKNRYGVSPIMLAKSIANFNVYQHFQ